MICMSLCVCCDVYNVCGVVLCYMSLCSNVFMPWVVFRRVSCVVVYNRSCAGVHVVVWCDVCCHM